MYQNILRIVYGLLLVFLVTVQPVSGQDSVKSPVQDSTAIARQYAPLKMKTGPHPDFILPSIADDEMIQLSKYRGKKVLLLHFASW